jgi:heme exporter protein C
MALADFANPSRFLTFANRAIPWLAGVTVIAFALGLNQVLSSPDDYQQGATVKIMYIHVPSAWLGMFGWGLMAIAGLGTLVWRHPLADVAAKTAAPIGAAFTLLCLVTGSLWGEPMWGTYWVWDGRLTSMLVLLLMYLGLITLWRSIDDPWRAGRVAAILTLVGTINLPIIKFSVECWNTLHQPASFMRFSPGTTSLVCKLLGSTPEPKLSTVDIAAAQGGSAIDASFLVPLLIMTLAFTLLFVTLHVAAMRNEILRRRVHTLRLLQASAAS